MRAPKVLLAARAVTFELEWAPLFEAETIVRRERGEHSASTAAAAAKTAGRAVGIKKTRRKRRLARIYPHHLEVVAG